jgi:hypothetical protein
MSNPGISFAVVAVTSPLSENQRKSASRPNQKGEALFYEVTKQVGKGMALETSISHYFVTTNFGREGNSIDE